MNNQKKLCDTTNNSNNDNDNDNDNYDNYDHIMIIITNILSQEATSPSGGLEVGFE